MITEEQREKINRIADQGCFWVDGGRYSLKFEDTIVISPKCIKIVGVIGWKHTEFNLNDVYIESQEDEQFDKDIKEIEQSITEINKQTEKINKISLKLGGLL